MSKQAETTRPVKSLQNGRLHLIQIFEKLVNYTTYQAAPTTESEIANPTPVHAHMYGVMLVSNLKTFKIIYSMYV